MTTPRTWRPRRIARPPLPYRPAPRPNRLPRAADEHDIAVFLLMTGASR